MLASTLPPIAVYYAIASTQARKDAELASVQLRLSSLTAAHEAVRHIPAPACPLLHVL
jgi:hypothetical protein